MHIDEVIWREEFAGKIAWKHGVSTDYQQAAELWDTHDTTDYPDAFESEPVELRADLKHRRYEVEIEEDLIHVLRLLQLRGR